MNNFIEDFFTRQQMVGKMITEADRRAYEDAESKAFFAQGFEIKDEPMEYKDIRGK